MNVPAIEVQGLSKAYYACRDQREARALVKASRVPVVAVNDFSSALAVAHCRGLGEPLEVLDAVAHHGFGYT